MGPPLTSRTDHPALPSRTDLLPLYLFCLLANLSYRVPARVINFKLHTTVPSMPTAWAVPCLTVLSLSSNCSLQITSFRSAKTRISGAIQHPVYGPAPTPYHRKLLYTLLICIYESARICVKLNGSRRGKPIFPSGPSERSWETTVFDTSKGSPGVYVCIAGGGGCSSCVLRGGIFVKLEILMFQDKSSRPVQLDAF